jgi:hypothetical protein
MLLGRSYEQAFKNAKLCAVDEASVKLIMRMDSLWENIVFATLCTIIAILFWITLFHLFQSWYLAHKQDQNSLDYSDTDTISVKSDKTLVNHAFNSLPV